MKIRSAVVSVAACAFASVLAVAVPASADVKIQMGQGQDACKVGYVCLYENNGYNSGGPARVVMLDDDEARLDYYCFNDATSSIVNRSAHLVRVFQDYDYRATAVTLLPGEVMDLNGTSFQDQASAVKFGPRIVSP
ncbi:peptidase inhibitor family I36 protein [Streptomyces sp. BR123]|uniref:peptidase inhibitor family I36 protein n=1 Tax=Streptomyces sp. BR123 TaxID=2749828 RepID=UPI0015C453EE|nr:peptidase inhibitor family I36 protein [Streptomyces sp. BR123]NXY97312.1 peptidase inhibitor family I36 protein [Streptomyces sp. BR123]